ncbi:alpha/beta fold hydrolase [Prauserella cavernicola]|uniref:Alpha/beta hydrolase n=1 Tax=Prauserella cavernicola TaxID=2800127 RepID=A0A934QW36_9PSEU|nr:alpha/beta hydrolase [Prauserella cavernicola]MBK1787262.1 alpha/beta hydrolase [Prauserella cavernicola]
MIAANARRDVPGLVDVGGRRLRVLVQGTRDDAPAVVFLSTLGCPLEAWTRVQRTVAEWTTAISYDRSDVGWNGRRAAVPRRADELEALLAELGVVGPVVLVGHAYGALVAEELARRNPDRVAGLVAADAWHPDELRRSVHQRKAMAHLEAQLQRSMMAALLRPGGREDFVALDGLPAEQRPMAYRYLRRPHNWRTALAELVSWKHSPPGSAERWPRFRAPALVLASRVQVEHDQVRMRMQQELAASSPTSAVLVVPEAANLELVTDGRFSPHVGDAVLRLLGNAVVTEGA